MSKGPCEAPQTRLDPTPPVSVSSSNLSGTLILALLALWPWTRTSPPLRCPLFQIGRRQQSLDFFLLSFRRGGGCWFGSRETGSGFDVGVEEGPSEDEEDGDDTVTASRVSGDTVYRHKARDRTTTHALRTSLNSHTPSIVCRTDRTADENMWVTGEVTLMESSPATQMRNPTSP